MEIGIITTRELEYNPGDLEDVKRAAEAMGIRTTPFYLDSASLSIDGHVEVALWGGHAERWTPRFAAAFLRHIGSPRSIDEYLFRVWVLKAMEANGTYISNPVGAWLTAHDKIGALTVLARHGVSVPPTRAAEDPVVLYREAQKFGRLVVKPIRGFMGLGAVNFDDPEEAMPYYVHARNTASVMLAQAYLEGAKAGDYRVIVVGGQVVGAVRRYSRGPKHNVSQGARVEPVDVDEDLASVAIKTVNVLGLDFAGIDVIADGDKYFVIDVNPTFSWQGFKRATGINPATHIVKLILEKARR